MTKQRFTMTANTKAVKEYDSGFRDSMNAYSRNIHGRLSYQEVVDLLNSLSEENEQLKQQKKGQELEIVRLHKLADAMSGVLRELGIYDVYNKEQINNVKKRLDK